MVLINQIRFFLGVTPQFKDRAKSVWDQNPNLGSLEIQAEHSTIDCSLIYEKDKIWFINSLFHFSWDILRVKSGVYSELYIASI